MMERDAGARVGAWTVKSREGRGYNCICVCGTTRWVHAHDLGLKSNSCGCRGGKRAVGRYLRGDHAHPLASTYKNMIARCTKPFNRDYPNYGGRGVHVHPEWMASFRSFASSVGERPTEQHTLDRIDNDKGYEPGNIRWATRADQARNQRKTRHVTVGGETLSVSLAAEKFGLSRKTINARLDRGVSDDQAVLPPQHRRAPPIEQQVLDDFADSFFVKREEL